MVTQQEGKLQVLFQKVSQTLLRIPQNAPLFNLIASMIKMHPRDIHSSSPSLLQRLHSLSLSRYELPCTAFFLQRGW